MNRYTNLVKNTMLFTISNFASKILVFLLVPLYTSTLTTKEYGIAELITTTINLIYPILTLTIGEAILRFSLDSKSNKVQVFSNGIRVAIVGFVIMILSIPILSKSDVLGQYKMIFIIMYIISTLNVLFTQFARGINKIKNVAISGVVNTIIVVVSNILMLVIFEFGIQGYLLSMILGSAVSTVYLFVTCSLGKYIDLKHSNNKVLTKMFKYSAPMIPNSISWWVSNAADRYIVTGYCGVEQNGIYSVAYKIPTILTIFTSIFMQAWQLSAVQEYESEDRNKFYSEIYSYYNAFILIIATLLILFNKILARILFSNEFFKGWVYVPFLIVAFVFYGLATYLGTMFTASKKTNILFVSTLFGAVTNIILNFILVGKYKNAIGASIATLIGYIIVWIIRLITSKKIVKLSYNKTRIGMCYILLIFQSCIAIGNNYYCIIGNTILSILICIINLPLIIKLAEKFKHGIIKKKSKSFN